MITRILYLVRHPITEILGWLSSVKQLLCHHDWKPIGEVSYLRHDAPKVHLVERDFYQMLQGFSRFTDVEMSTCFDRRIAQECPKCGAFRLVPEKCADCRRTIVPL